MKIAVPVDEDRKTVCIVFGRAPFFAVRDTETGEITCFPNPAAEAQGGAGVQAAQAVIDSGADVLLTVRLGENSAELLKEAEIAIYKTDGTEAASNFEAYAAGRLSPLTQFHSGYHGIR